MTLWYLDHIALNGRLSDELERIWKEAVVAQSRYCPGIYLGLRKNMENLSIASVSALIQTHDKSTALPLRLSRWWLRYKLNCISLLDYKLTLLNITVMT
jgi:hypothetical protein